MPLPMLEGALQVISVDLIEGLPKSTSYNGILVLDTFSKYTHFIPLTKYSPANCGNGYFQIWLTVAFKYILSSTIR